MTARVLGQAGARVMLADISGREVEQTAATLVGEGYDIAWQTVDISDEATAKALADETVARLAGWTSSTTTLPARVRRKTGLSPICRSIFGYSLMASNARGTC